MGTGGTPRALLSANPPNVDQRDRASGYRSAPPFLLDSTGCAAHRLSSIVYRLSSIVGAMPDTITSQQVLLPAIEPVPVDEVEISEPFTAPVAPEIVAPEQAAEVATATPADDRPLSKAEHRVLRRQVLMLSWPVIIENLLQSMIGFVDTALVGHLGTDALAGVGGAQQLVWLVTSFLSAIMMGATVLVAH